MNAVLKDPASRSEGDMLSLTDIDRITDFYVWDVSDLDEGVSTAMAFAGKPAAKPVAETPVAAWLRGLLAHVRSTHPNETDFRVEYTHKDQLYLYRGHRDLTVNHPLLCLRRHPTVCPRLEDLNLPKFWGELLMQARLLKGGLILVAAVTGQGKSTTIAGTVRSRLEKFAGFCRSIEDPPELPLHGTHGDGICIQTPVDAKHGRDGFAEALRSALRSFPALPSGGTICVVGEVRDAETAAVLLQAAVNGHLVIATVHANDINTACSRIASLASGAMPELMARELLASGLVYAIHQTLTFDVEAEGWKRGKIGGDFLASFDNASPVATMIRDGLFKSLPGAVEAQRAILKNAANVGDFIKRVGPGVGP
ncbi:MAG: hypothetical protein BGP25_05565 [Lysobacterales bacterium 63-13]|nr:MAG: hypothetical protein BGP25_05565 [Xanthomonadales bacterium 63-13]